MSRAPRASLRALPLLVAALASGVVPLSPLAPSAARAAEPEGRHRVLFVTREATPFSARVRAEIEAMGFEVETSSTLFDEAPDAVAAARVVESPRRVELWIASGAGGRLTLRTVVMPLPGDDEATETVRASEQLRAFFQPLRQSAPPVAPSLTAAPAEPPAPPPSIPTAPGPAPSLRLAPAAPPPPAAPPSLEPAAPSRLLVGAGLSAAFQPGGAALHLDVEGRWVPFEHLAFGGLASVPLAGSTVKATEGSASITAPLFGLEVTGMARPHPRLRLTASGGMAVAWVRTTGLASAPYFGRSSDAVTAAPILGAAVAPRLTDHLSVALQGRAGVALAPIDISFAGRQVAAWGRPLGMIGVALEFEP